MTKSWHPFEPEKRNGKTAETVAMQRETARYASSQRAVLILSRGNKTPVKLFADGLTTLVEQLPFAMQGLTANAAT